MVSPRLEKLEQEFLNSGGKWEKCCIESVFDLTSTKCIFHAKQLEIFNDEVEESFPYVVRSERNNGVKGYIKKERKYLNPANTISFAQDTFVTFWQEKPYFTGNKIKVLIPREKNINRKIGLFFTSSINKILSDMSWGIGSSEEEIKKYVITLPFLNDEICFTYMEKYIEELEYLHIEELEALHTKELEAYLGVTGLSDYQLTKDDNDIINRFKNLFNEGMAEFDTEESLSSFTVRELFGEEFIFRGKRIKSSDRKIGNIPFVTAGTCEMGISSYICREQINVFSRDSLTIDMFGNVFFRGYEYGADDHVTVLENNKNKFSRYVLQFIQPLIEKFIEGKFAYSRNFYPKDSYDIKIKLPINNGKLDSEFMEKFIIVVQKLVIKDLVICANKKIEAMKRLVYES
ncbi:restriction endonuclease subunit S [Clostridium perfringens]|uniref:restriction endonuclease subunit S n=1 Tax=Clostridium perfringens TaxID=1502 RepID=UPI002246E476|nr:restriction endonuclease subunit S [Clostridium perfringens]MCX0407615.1 restriction endonuclease subunit S [Clostridium perfringens]